MHTFNQVWEGASDFVVGSHMYVVHISQVSKRAKQKSLVCTRCIYSLFTYSNGIVLLGSHMYVVHISQVSKRAKQKILYARGSRVGEVCGTHIPFLHTVMVLCCWITYVRGAYFTSEQKD